MDNTASNPKIEQDKLDTDRFLAMVTTIRDYLTLDVGITQLKESASLHFESADSVTLGDPNTRRVFTYNIIEID